MPCTPLGAEPHPSRSRAHIPTAPIQALLNWDAPIETRPTTPRAHTPQHNPLRQAGLQRACHAILDLVEDGRPHTWRELQAVGGSRAAARVAEIREAGFMLLGPRAWQSPDGSRVTETEPMRDGEESYRMVRG